MPDTPGPGRANPADLLRRIGHVRPFRAGQVRPAHAAVVFVFTAAGLLFATSAETARGTQLRSDRADAVDVIRRVNAHRAERGEEFARLTAEVDAASAALAERDSELAELRRQAARSAPQAGLAAVRGPAVAVVLDDARHDGTLPAGARPDDVVVHQQDVQAVVNALWHGGAEAMQIMDQRVVATSAVRCVGNTLLLQGQVYAPPYRIVAIGDVPALQRALDADPTIDIYREYVNRYGLKYTVSTGGEQTLPAFAGPLNLPHVRAVPAAPAPGPTPAPTPGPEGDPVTGSANGSATGPATGRTQPPPSGAPVRR